MIWKKGCEMDSMQLLASGTLSYVTGVFLLAASCQSCRIVDTIPPQNLTETRLLVTYNRIQNFWNQHGKVPTKLAELPDVKNRDCSIKDGWGRELNCDSDGTSKVKVWSFGRDGKPGALARMQTWKSSSWGNKRARTIFQR